nr:amidohydrolase [Acidobacteriota bacterium]
GLALGDVDLAGLTTLLQVQDKIRAFAAANPASPWVVGQGWLYSAFPGGAPTREQLDSIVSDRPAVMNCYDGHSIWVNSKALAMAGITKHTADPINGVVVKDARTGEPTGHLKESAADIVNRIMPQLSDDDRRAGLRAAIAEAHRFGVTSIQNAGGRLEDLELYEEARNAGELRVRTYLALSASADTTDADLDRMEAAWKKLGDDATLKTGAVKIFADGVIESRTAALLAPYTNSGTAGAPNLSPDALTKLVTMIDKRGWQIWIHAIGDRAIRMSLDAFEQAAAVNPVPARGRRHRLEHIETIDPTDIPRFARLGVIASLDGVVIVFVLPLIDDLAVPDDQQAVNQPECSGSNLGAEAIKDVRVDSLGTRRGCWPGFRRPLRLRRDELREEHRRHEGPDKCSVHDGPGRNRWGDGHRILRYRPARRATIAV